MTPPASWLRSTNNSTSRLVQTYIPICAPDSVCAALCNQVGLEREVSNEIKDLSAERQDYSERRKDHDGSSECDVLLWASAIRKALVSLTKVSPSLPLR